MFQPCGAAGTDCCVMIWVHCRTMFFFSRLISQYSLSSLLHVTKYVFVEFAAVWLAGWLAGTHHSCSPVVAEHACVHACVPRFEKDTLACRCVHSRSERRILPACVCASLDVWALLVW